MRSIYASSPQKSCNFKNSQKSFATNNWLMKRTSNNLHFFKLLLENWQLSNLKWEILKVANKKYPTTDISSKLFKSPEIVTIAACLIYFWDRMQFFLIFTLSEKGLKSRISKPRSHILYTVKTMDNVRDHFAAFLAFKTKSQRHIIFYFLKVYNFGFNEIFVGSTIAVLSYSTHESQKSRPNQTNREKIIFQVQFWSASNQ